MKKIFVVLAMLLVSVSLMATPKFQIGVLASYNKLAIDINGEDLNNADNFSFGADVRINPIKYLSIDIPATFGVGDNPFTIGILPSINGNIPVVSFLDISLGVGIQMEFQKFGSNWFFNGSDFSNFGEAFLYSRPFYRASALLNVGLVGIGINATVPTKGSFKDFDVVPQFKETRVSASVLFNFG